MAQRLKTSLRFFIISSLLAWLTPALALNELIYLDSGHAPQFPGAIGTCDTPEVWVNDHVTLKLTRALQASGYRVLFSRPLNFERSEIARRPARVPDRGDLRRRAEGANRARAALFVSIHHDSLFEEVLTSEGSPCQPTESSDGKMVTPEFKARQKIGFNVFVFDDTNQAKYDNSVRLAERIGQEMLAAEQVPSNIHLRSVEPRCSSCEWVNSSLGVIKRDLGVLRRPTMPAVLVEVTNLRVPELEKLANDPAYQELMAQTIKKGIDRYFGR